MCDLALLNLFSHRQKLRKNLNRSQDKELLQKRAQLWVALDIPNVIV